MDSRRFVLVLAMCCLWWIEAHRCESELPGLAREEAQPADIVVFRAVADFVLQLNELIKHLSMYSQDDSLDTGTVVERTGKMWNQTEATLEALVSASGIRWNNRTGRPLHDALEAVRSERIHFMERMKQYDEIDSSTIIESAKIGVNVHEPSMALVMHWSVHGLTAISADLLRSMQNGVLRGTFHDRPRANPTKLSIATYGEGFKRIILDTQRNFATQADRAVKRVRSHLSELEQTPELGGYVTNLSKLYATFKANIKTMLDRTLRKVLTSIMAAGSMIDVQLSSGIAGLLTKVVNYDQYDTLHVCVDRYVFKFFDQSLAVAKLLYCSQPEITTLEYLVSVAKPILNRAAVSDSAPVQMDVVCAIGSESCTMNFYSSLVARETLIADRLHAYANFTQQELLCLEQRIDICVQSVALDVGTYVDDVNVRFDGCLVSGAA